MKKVRYHWPTGTEDGDYDILQKYIAKYGEPLVKYEIIEVEDGKTETSIPCPE
jgi:hypothetical protein